MRKSSQPSSRQGFSGPGPMEASHSMEQSRRRMPEAFFPYTQQDIFSVEAGPAQGRRSWRPVS